MRVFVLYALSRVFAKGNARYPVWTCRDPIFSDSRDPIFKSRDPIGSLKRLNKALDLVFDTKP